MILRVEISIPKGKWMELIDYGAVLRLLVKLARRVCNKSADFDNKVIVFYLYTYSSGDDRQEVPCGSSTSGSVYVLRWFHDIRIDRLPRS